MYTKLFEQNNLKSLSLQNRFVMAPMTRSRSSQPGDVPNDIMVEYYRQRTSAGLIITEATQISLQGKGYARTPGIYTEEQIEAWKKITKIVHENGSKIFSQLWHVGRISSSKVNGLQPIAPSALAAKDTNVYIFDGVPNGDATFVPVEEPKEMTIEDIKKVIDEYIMAAKNAISAGFDGVEIHGANGYLIDEFLRSNSNKRIDDYGGTTENRIRFMLEVTQAVANTIGHDRTGLRISPFIRFKDMDDPEILDTIMLAAQKLNLMDIAYLHLSEADWDDAPQIPEDFRIDLRKKFHSTIIATGNKTPEEGERLLEQGLIDLVGFGRKFLTNPDYPYRVKNNLPLNVISNTHKLFGGGGIEGYSDYPFYTKS